jgi:hypothetical protein
MWHVCPNPRQTSSEGRHRERTPQEAPASQGETGRSGRGSRPLRQAGLLKKATSQHRETKPAARSANSARRVGRPRHAGGIARLGPPTSTSVFTTSGNRGGDGPRRQLRGVSSPHRGCKAQGSIGRSCDGNVAAPQRTRQRIKALRSRDGAHRPEPRPPLWRARDRRASPGSTARRQRPG